MAAKSKVAIDLIIALECRRPGTRLRNGAILMNDLDAACWKLVVRGNDARQIARMHRQSPEWGEVTVERLFAAYNADPAQILRGHIEKLICEINLVRQAAWLGWERSLRDKQKTVRKAISGGSQDGKSESTTTTETQAGDAPFLRILIDCNRRESALRGIDRSSRLPAPSNETHIDLDTLIQQVEAANRESV